jgi:hypothetical protein
MHPAKTHDVVALLVDLPDRNLRRGQVGTIVETLGPDVFEVEFSDDDGRTYASLALKCDQFIVLHYQAVTARS